MKSNSMPLLGASIATFALTITGYSQPPPEVTVRLDQAVHWTTEGNDTVWLTVQRGNAVAQEAFTVHYATSDLTAKAGLDYETASGVLSFATGEMNRTVAITILDDQVAENEESFRVTLSDPTGWAQLRPPATATVKILQDTVLRARNTGANLTHTQERESVTFSFTSPAGPISVRGDLPELGNDNPDHAVRLVRGPDSVWRASVSLPANRTYTYRFYQGNNPAGDPVTAQTRSVTRQPAAKAVYEVFPGGPGRAVVDPEGDIMAGLIRQGIVGEAIVVGIDIDTGASDPQATRTRDYLPPGDQLSGVQGAADRYVQYIIQELKPLIDARYRTRPGPESTFTAGQSRGANVALYMAWDFPQVFTRAGMHSGAFENAPNFTARVKREPGRAIRLYLDSGEDYLAGVLALRNSLVVTSPPYVIEDSVRSVYARGQQHLTEDFGSRRSMMLSFLYPVTEETNELVPRLEIVTSNGTRLRVGGPAGLPGRLQRSRDLREWSDWQLVTCGGELVDISEPQASLVTAQLYRVVVP